MKLISRTAAAKLLDCTPQTITNYAKQGLIDEVVRENAGRSTMFYDEDQLCGLLPALHELEELKGRVQAEQEQLRLELANLAKARDEARREHLKIHGGKKTLSHLQLLVMGAYNYAQKTTAITKGQQETAVLQGLLTGQTLQEISASTKLTEYRISQTIKSIAKRLAKLPPLIWENDFLNKENEKLRKENNLLRITSDYRVKPQNISIRRIVTAESPEGRKEVAEIPSQDRMKVTPITDLNISDSSKAGLKFNGITTLYQLLQYKERELSDMKKIGLDRASEINSYLMKLGLTLGMTADSE